jgi:predicted nucleic acid-binding protein
MLEIANSLLSLSRRQRLSSDTYSDARLLFTRLRPIIDDEGAKRALTTVSELAERCKLTVYDAAYLELAVRRNLPLASRDGALNKAALGCGVHLLL